MRKFIKYFEQNKVDINFSDIHKILIDIIDDGNYVLITSANGIDYNPKFMIPEDFEFTRFKLKRNESDKNQTFSFQIGFDYELNFSELTDFISGLNAEIGRFSDFGFIVDSFDITSSVDSSSYKATGLYFKMINFDN